VRGSAASCYDGVSVASGEADAEDGAEAIVESESEYNIGAAETVSPDGAFVDQTPT
jgi:hypothetical protein